MNRSFFILLLTIVFCRTDATAQAFKNAGSAGSQFLKIGVGARASAMGGAYASIAEDPAALAWNPGAIGLLNSVSAEVDHTEWAAGLGLNFVGIVVPITDRINIGFHSIWLTSGDIEITTIDKPEGTGEMYDAGSIAVGMTSSVRLTPQLSFAVTMKYIQERIYDVSGSTVAADAGMWYDTEYRSLRLGFTVLNLGFDNGFTGKSLDVRYEPPSLDEPAIKSEMQTGLNQLPLTFRAAGSFDLFSMFFEPLKSQRLTTAVNFIQYSDTPEQVALGAEYAWNDLLFLRAGYLFNDDELGWNAGVGLHLNLTDINITIDYASRDLGRFGLGHCFGISFAYR
jgi:hypothetical protein